MELVGHEEVYQNIVKIIDNTPVILISGEPFIGKSTLCKKLIFDFCIQQGVIFDEVFNRDVLFYEKPSVTDIRDARTKAIQPPFKLPVKWILYKNIENYSIESLNALLKILEDCPKQTKFLLTSSDESKVLNTIKGRCYKFQLYPISDTVIAGYLVSQGMKAENASTISRISNGSVFLAKQLQSKVDLIDIIKAIISWFQNLTINNIENIWTDIDYIFKSFERDVFYRIFFRILADIWQKTINNKTDNPYLMSFDVSKTRFLLKRGFLYIFDRTKLLYDNKVSLNDATQLKSLFLEIINVGK